jgi:hypothetical protein
MENYAGCNEGLATEPGKVDVLLHALLRRFDRTQGSVVEEKSAFEYEMSPLTDYVSTSR